LVDGDGDSRQICLQPGGLYLADLLQHVVVKLHGKAVPLEQVHEGVGHQEAKLGAVPAHQGFGSQGVAGGQIIFGLQPDLEFLGRQGLVHEAFHFLPAADFSGQLLVVDYQFLVTGDGFLIGFIAAVHEPADIDFIFRRYRGQPYPVGEVGRHSAYVHH
jgi:hypothetical protein